MYCITHSVFTVCTVSSVDWTQIMQGYLETARCTVQFASISLQDWRDHLLHFYGHCICERSWRRRDGETPEQTAIDERRDGLPRLVNRIYCKGRWHTWTLPSTTCGQCLHIIDNKVSGSNKTCQSIVCVVHLTISNNGLHRGISLKTNLGWTVNTIPYNTKHHSFVPQVERQQCLCFSFQLHIKLKLHLLTIMKLS